LKRLFAISILIVIATNAFAQELTTDNKNVAVSLTSYLYAFNTKLEMGSYAMGPTVLLNANGKLAFQFGALFGFRKYRYESSMGPSYYYNVFIPAIIQYNYLSTDRITLDANLGAVFGGRHILSENNRAHQIGGLSLVFGTGIAWRLLQWLAVRTYPTIRYNSGNFYPGISFDISLLFEGKIP